MLLPLAIPPVLMCPRAAQLRTRSTHRTRRPLPWPYALLPVGPICPGTPFPRPVSSRTPVCGLGLACACKPHSTSEYASGPIIYPVAALSQFSTAAFSLSSRFTHGISKLECPRACIGTWHATRSRSSGPAPHLSAILSRVGRETAEGPTKPFSQISRPGNQSGCVPLNPEYLLPTKHGAHSASYHSSWMVPYPSSSLSLALRTPISVISL